MELNHATEDAGAYVLRLHLVDLGSGLLLHRSDLCRRHPGIIVRLRELAPEGASCPGNSRCQRAHRPDDRSRRTASVACHRAHRVPDATGTRSDSLSSGLDNRPHRRHGSEEARRVRRDVGDKISEYDRMWTEFKVSGS